MEKLIKNKLALKSGDEIKEVKNYFIEGFNKFEMRKWLEELILILSNSYNMLGEKYKETFREYIKKNEKIKREEDYEDWYWNDLWYSNKNDFIIYLVRNKIKEYK